MPLQNRVLPTQQIVYAPLTGVFMGNRGRIHENKQINKAWEKREWKICSLEGSPKLLRDGSQWEVMGPRGYTELYFLDEPTALAAGHRPCAQCRLKAANEFAARAGVANVTDVDPILKAERNAGTPTRTAPRVHPMPAAALPVGAMAIVGETVFARHERGFIAWSLSRPDAYLSTLDDVASDVVGFRQTLAAGDPVDALTPPLTQSALAAGYVPVWHPSAATAAVVA